MTVGWLADRSVLEVKDDVFIAQDPTDAFQDLGLDAPGPVATDDDALDLLDGTEHLDDAAHDFELQGEMACPVTDALRQRGVRITFAAG